MLKLTKKSRERNKKEADKDTKTIARVAQDEELEEHLTILGSEDRSAVERVTRDVDSKIVAASTKSATELKMIGEGRCPECGHKVHNFLFTTMCDNCGWSSFIRPEKGRTVVHLRGGGTLVCEEAFYAPEEVLCVTEDVVRYRVPRLELMFIEFDWPEEEIGDRRTQLEREERGMCSWCGKTYFPNRRSEDEDEDRRVTFVAFGQNQERYLFCCREHQAAFHKQYPARVHRDCYHRDCSGCNECLKRFDDTSPETFLEEDLVH